MTLLLHLQNFFPVNIKQITYRRNQGNHIFHQRIRRGLKKRVIVNVSDSLSDCKENDISFQKNPVNMSKHRQNVTSTHLQKQYPEYKKKSIHEKSSLLNTKLTCAKKSTDNIKANVSRFKGSVFSEVQKSRETSKTLKTITIHLWNLEKKLMKNLRIHLHLTSFLHLKKK